MSDEGDMDEEITPWEAAQREEEGEDVKRVYHHLRVGPLFIAALTLAVTVGVFCGLCIFNQLYPLVGL